MIHIIVAPLRVPQSSKTDFILNINNYRNIHGLTLNKTKVNYKDIMLPILAGLPVMDKVAVTYVLYPASRRRTDLMNVVSIHSKYFLDTLVKAGKIPDDSYHYVIKESTAFGEVDTKNPRVDILIEDLSWL